MRPIPVAFHVWFLELHTYGIGLALTFWFGLRYAERRIRKAGYPWQWVTGMFVWVIVAAIVGARAFHVISNLSYYTHDPGQVFAVWQGGLSSFGGIIFAVPVAIFSSRRRCPELKTMRFADLMAPVLMACWGIGRLLGPQLMVAGGGHPTHQWFGMYYAGQTGRRLPVPIFQSIEDFTIFGILLLVERWLRTRQPAVAPVLVTPSGEEIAPSDTSLPSIEAPSEGIIEAPSEGIAASTNGIEAAADGDGDGEEPRPTSVVPATLPPSGIVLGVGMILWGIERYFDEHLWLGEDGHLGSLLVQAAGIGLVIAGVLLLAFKVKPFRQWMRGEGGDPARPPIELTTDTGQDDGGDQEEAEVSRPNGSTTEESDDGEALTPPHGVVVPASATAPSSPSTD
jgi:phosphatidylglycerol---prolipoprotein diacylglyceryl transferase